MNWETCATIFRTLSAETALTLGALLVLTADIALFRKKTLPFRTAAAAFIAALSIAAAIAAPYLLPAPSNSLPANLGILLTPATNAARLLILIFGLLALGIYIGTARLKNPAENVAITLFALAGLTLMCAAENLLVIFTALELASISLYILAGFDKSRPESAEAGLKYFLFGGTAAAFLLFGFSLFFGLTGELSLSEIATRLTTSANSPLLLVAAFLAFAGFAYKTAIAPFHLWAPDTYEGSPAATGALIASASKIGGLLLLARFLSAILYTPTNAAFTSLRNPPLELGIFAAIILSLLLGNAAALAQTGVRRLLAYSAIAHAGVMLIAAWNVAQTNAIPDHSALPASHNLLYYLLAYGIANIGAFGVVAILESAKRTAITRTDSADADSVLRIADLAGLWKRSPFLGGTMLVFILSLAGVPPLAGFFAKFFVFTDALVLSDSASATATNPMFWVVLLAIAMSAVALYYYLQILKSVFVAKPAPTADNDALATTKIHVHPVTALVLLLSAAALLAIGIAPNLLPL